MDECVGGAEDPEVPEEFKKRLGELQEKVKELKVEKTGGGLKNLFAVVLSKHGSLESYAWGDKYAECKCGEIIQPDWFVNLDDYSSEEYYDIGGELYGKNFREHLVNELTREVLEFWIGG